MMNYHHILVAIELSEDSNLLIQRAVFLAKLLNADVSLIHIDGSHGEIYPEIFNITHEQTQAPINQNTVNQLKAFETNVNYPIKHIFIGTGDLSDKLEELVLTRQVDLVICGHHHDFWSKIISYSRNLVHKSPVDLLVVPLK
jgi:nucleotide-binding universal stress UspA family protein